MDPSRSVHGPGRRSPAPAGRTRARGLTTSAPERLESLQARIRALSLPDALRLARSGSLSERMALERTFGKLVWEQLIQNPSVTVPEAARIAGMGTLPLPLIDQIVGNPAWLASDEVRRRLLTNPRLRGQALMKVLRAVPRAELPLIAQQPGLPYAAREAARRLLKGL